jgi:hypothetical protein
MCKTVSAQQISLGKVRSAHCSTNAAESICLQVGKFSDEFIFGLSSLVCTLDFVFQKFMMQQSQHLVEVPGPQLHPAPALHPHLHPPRGRKEILPALQSPG